MTVGQALRRMGLRTLLAVAAAAVFGLAGGVRAQAPAASPMSAGTARFEVRINLLPQGYQLQVSIVGDDGGVVKSVRVRSRREGERTWMTFNGDTANVATLSSAEYYVEGLDANGIVVLRDGSETAPLVVGKPAGIALAPAPSPRSNAFTADDERKKGGSALPWILAGAGVVAVAATVVIVVLATSADGAPKGATTVSPPVLR